VKTKCSNCNHDLGLNSLFATWTKSITCNTCKAVNYRSHPLSQLAFYIATGMTAILLIGFFYTDYDLSFESAIIAFIFSALFFAIECIVLPLKSLDLNYKKKIDRREAIWVLVIFILLIIMFIEPHLL
jgi:hypothetical membrane protein